MILMPHVKAILDEIRELGIVTVEELNSFFKSRDILLEPEQEEVLISDIDSKTECVV